MKKLFFFFFLAYSVSLEAQYRNPYFNVLSVENGLPEGYVKSFRQDKLGYMWFGTQNGLVRYDGYSLKKYPLADEKGNRLLISPIDFIYEDSAGKIWVTMSSEGIYCLDRKKDAFYKVKTNKAYLNAYEENNLTNWIPGNMRGSFWILTINKKKSARLIAFDSEQNLLKDYSRTSIGVHSLQDYTNISLARDKGGRIWLRADSLLNLFDPGTGSFSPYFVIPDSSKQSSFLGLIPDPIKTDLLWMVQYSGVTNGEKNCLLRINTSTKTVKIFSHDTNDPTSIAEGCNRIFIDSLKRIWCSTNNGISFYDPGTGSFTNYDLHLPLSIFNRANFINSIAADKEGNLWMGGFFQGLYWLNVKTGLVSLYSYKNQRGSIPYHDQIDKLFFDRFGTLWVGMPYYGIAYLDRKRSLFNPTTNLPSLEKAGSLLNQEDSYVFGMQGDSIFLVKDNNGLYAWNYLQNNFANIDLKNKYIYKQITAVLSDNDGIIWIGTYTSGLFSYDPHTKKVINYKHNPKDSTSISSNEITTLTKDSEGNILVGTTASELCRVNRQNGKFSRYRINTFGNLKQVYEPENDLVTAICADNNAIIWTGTEIFGSINRLDSKTGEVRTFKTSKIKTETVVLLFSDNHDRLWGGTYLSGLILLDKKTGTIKNYTEKDGLLDNSVVGINEDKDGNIWIATTKGFSKFDVANNRFTNFPSYIGMYLILSNKLFQGVNGLLSIPVKNGVITFDPAHLTKNSAAPQLNIESVSYALTGQPNKKDSVIFTDGIEKLTLRYNENRIGFQYAALHYADATLNRYAYKLEGYDNDWIQAGAQRSVTYGPLPPATYTFHVKAANSDGVWNETGASFSFTILPPWWETWWFRVLSVIALIIVIYAIIKERSQKLKAENILLEKKVNERTHQLQQSILDLKSTQAQLIQSEKMASLGELTAGIAHEIQNPLNFVNNFSDVNKELLEELKDEADKGNISVVKAIANNVIDNEQKINHHGKRADSIVKGMLEHSRASTGKKEPTDINALADEYLRLSYHGLRAKDKSFNVTLRTDFDESIGKINIIPQDIGRVLLNLFNNAFYAINEKTKQNTDSYQPTISISTKKINNKIEISVSDNGNGIPQKAVDKIFQPFFTTKPTGQGTGLGLSLSYDIIKAHGGEIKVVTKQGEGSEFVIQLPVILNV